VFPNFSAFAKMSSKKISMTLAISVTILTKNSQKYLSEVLSALQIFDQVLVCDTGSQDETINIARSFPNVTLYERSFIGFGPTHNVASSLAKYDWILSIDSDEIVTPELANEIQALTLSRGHIYSFPRHNEYRGKWIRWCGWHPDRQIRLYHRLDTQFSDAQVHEAVESRHLQEIPLQSPLRHYSYACTEDFLHKMQSYSTLFALQYKGKRSSSLTKALAHGFYSFFKSYILKRGFLGGQAGFEISFYNANTAFYKYLKLAEANRVTSHHNVKSGDKCGDVQKKRPIF
jgi:glycosyltransferase involved in cell wall biosynthesis